MQTVIEALKVALQEAIKDQDMYRVDTLSRALQRLLPNA